MNHARLLSLACAAALALTLGACGAGSVPPPRPADPLGDAAGGEERATLRRAWIEEMHRAAPGQDWRAIERANQAAELARRGALARSSARATGPGMVSQPLGSLTWEEVGSRNQAGHTRCAALGPARAGVRELYVGSANGGLWRGPPDGSDWEPISDHVFGGVDDVVVLEPANLADEDVVVYRRGRDVYRSDDGGATWTTALGLSALGQGLRMVELPDAQRTILVLGNAFVSGLRTALYASTDGGLTFSLRWTFSSAWSGDVWAPGIGAGAGSDVYVLHEGTLHASTDAGASFAPLGSVASGASQGHLSGSEAGAPTLYVVLRLNDQWRLHRSDDGGLSAPFVRNLNDYWGVQQSLSGFPSNPLAVVVGGVDAYRSFDGGQTLTRINSWTAYYGNPAARLHADIRGISVVDDPDSAAPRDLCWFNTDGGTYLSTNMGLSVANLCLEGLGVGQFYSTLTSANDPDLIVGGTQDQGYQRGTREPYTGSGPSTPLAQLISGDYGHFTSTDGTHGRVICTYPGFVLIQNGELNPTLDMESFPAGAGHLWLPPVVADPLDVDAFFFLGDRLWRHTRSGSAWTPSLYSSHDFAAGAGSYLSALAFAPSDPQRAYAATDAGRLWWSTDRGVTWTESADAGPTAHYFYGSTLLVDPADPLRALAGGSGYGTAGVRVTSDGGQTWQAMTQGLPSTLVHDLAWEPGGTGAVFAATEAGAWRWDPASGAWENAMGLAAPATTYWSVETVETTATLRFGTYGRGIWDCVVPDGEVGTRYCSPANPNSSGDSARIRALGSRLVADGDLTLSADRMPPDQFGYFLTSSGTDFIPGPGGSQGNLCIAPGSDLGRFVSQVRDSGAGGAFEIAVDLTALPLAGGPHAVAAGETWHFQGWFRDVGGASNFTDAVTVAFL